jgi:hypothetical protein
MARRQPRAQPTWTDVKAKLAGFDRLGLLGLIQDLYAANKDNRTFLRARSGLGQDVLAPYKEALDRWLWPDCIAEPGHVRRQGQTRHLQLQKSCWRPGRSR